MQASLIFLSSRIMALLLGGILCTSLAADAIDMDKKAIQIAITTEPPSLNTLKATDQVSFFIIEHVMEGLLAYDAKGRLIPGIAERWHMDEQGATFYLRKNARWSDGKPLTAHDFVFAWQRLVSPETASRYAFILSPVKNAKRISAGKLAVENLGVKALDDNVLQVTFERPTPYFLSLTTFPSYFPVRKDFYLKHRQRYFADIEHMLFNGPYVLTKWVHGAAMRLEKNEQFWNADNIHINVIDIPYITSDSKVTFNLFRNGEIISAGLDADTIRQALQERMYIKQFSLGAVFYIQFNFREGHITANKNFRKAIQHIFDAEALVDKVIALPGNKAAHSIFPSWLEGKEQKFLKEYPPKKVLPDKQQAQAYLQAALIDLGLTKLPSLVLLTSDSPMANKEAEYLQALFKENLDIDIRIDKQIFKQRLAKMSEGDFDLVLGSWGPDYNDPSTFGDLFYSENSNNYGRFAHEDYDRLVLVAMSTNDTETRMKAFAGMQDIIVEEVVVLPKFERGIVYVEDPRIKNVSRRIFGGDPSFRYAELIEQGQE